MASLSPPFSHHLSSGQLSLAFQKSALHFLDALHFLVSIFLSFDLSYLSFAKGRLHALSCISVKLGCCRFSLSVDIAGVVTPLELPPTVLRRASTSVCYSGFFFFCLFFFNCCFSFDSSLASWLYRRSVVLNYYIFMRPPTYFFSVIHVYFHTTWFGKVLDMISVF